MFIDENSVKIDNVPMGQYLASCTFGYHKIWSSDSGRNMAYEQKGSLGGIFPKLTLNFNCLTADEMHVVSALLNKEKVILKYYDPEYMAIVTQDCYSSDWEFSQEHLNISEPFSAAIITNKRRISQ